MRLSRSIPALALAFNLVALPSFAAKVPALEDFQGIRWGSTEVETVAKLQGQRYAPQGDAGDSVPVFLGAYGDFKNTAVSPRFYLGKLIGIDLTVPAQEGLTIVTVFSQLVGHLRRTYGEPTAAHSIATDTEVRTDRLQEIKKPQLSDALAADILARKAEIGALWGFKDHSTLKTYISKRDPDNAASELVVTLIYASPMEAGHVTLD